MPKPPYDKPITYDPRIRELLLAQARTPDEAERRDSLRQQCREYQIESLVAVRGVCLRLNVTYDQVVNDAITASGNVAYEVNRPHRSSDGWPCRHVAHQFARKPHHPQRGFREHVALPDDMHELAVTVQCRYILDAMEIARLINARFEDLCREAHRRFLQSLH